MASVVFFFALMTTFTCVTALGDASHRLYRAGGTWNSGSAYSDFNSRARTNYLRTSGDHGYSQIHSSRETIQKRAALLWEQTKASVRESGEGLRKGQNLDYYYPKVLYVLDNGADPTGVKDSTAALQKTVDEAFEVPDSHDLLPDIPDLGGVEIHLEGGDYLISKPIQFSYLGGGNLRGEWPMISSLDSIGSIEKAAS